MSAPRRVLLMHINSHSGHHRASCAIERTLARLDPSAEIENLDAFTFTSRITRWGIMETYHSLIRHQPDVWEYLYDNPAIARRLRHFRALLHHYHAAKLERVLDRVRPDAIACTQAYPCGVIADFKKHHGLRVPLVGVLTDYAPHVYWFHDTVDAYVVPSESVKQRFVSRGVDAARVHVQGIPIEPAFERPAGREETARQFGLNPHQPVLLIMGGGGGFGRLREIVQNLDTLPYPCQLVVLAGTNRSLLSWIHGQRFRHRVLGLGYTEDVPKLMSLATLLISKPGGMTTSEALARQLPIVIVNPIPGQEAYNARFLLSQGAAVQAGSPETVRQTVRDLLENADLLARLRRRAGELAHPRAASDIAGLLLGLADRYRESSAPAVPKALADAPISAG